MELWKNLIGKSQLSPVYAMILHILTHSGKTLNCRSEPGHIKTPQSYGIQLFKRCPEVSRIQMHT